jgi:hypothetical protein
MKNKSELYNTLVAINYWKTVGDDVQYAIFSDEEYLYLAFQQSVSKRDWQVNFNFPAKLYKNQKSCILAARGWGNAYKSCNDEIMNDFITKLKADVRKKPVICGWSYGGAMSLLAAEDLHYRTGHKPTVITYGAPKPLFGLKTKNYVLSCVSEVYQYTHVNDLVTIMPPLAGYCRLKTDKIGEKFNLIKFFNPEKYHCIYGEKNDYLY